MATQTVQATNTAPKKKIKIAPIVCFIVTVLLAVLFVYPVYFAVISAFKSNGEILKAPLAFPTEMYLQNFKDLFAKTDFFTAIWHTVFLTVVSEVLIILVVPLSAYAIERHNSKATKFVYAYFTAGMMIPFHLYMFPLFKEMKVFHIYGTLWGPVICYIAGSVAFGTLLYTSFLKGVPIDIEEAAKIDGCTEFKAFWRVVFPLLGPCTASLVVLNGLGIVLSPEDNPGYLPGLNSGAFNLGAGLSYAVLYAAQNAFTASGGATSGYIAAMVGGVILLGLAFCASLLIPKPGEQK